MTTAELGTRRGAGWRLLNLQYHDKRIPLPKGFVIGHALLAVGGYALIFMSAFR